MGRGECMEPHDKAVRAMATLGKEPCLSSLGVEEKCVEPYDKAARAMATLGKEPYLATNSDHTKPHGAGNGRQHGGRGEVY